MCVRIIGSLFWCIVVLWGIEVVSLNPCVAEWKEYITFLCVLLQCNGDLGELLEEYNDGDGTPSSRNYHDILHQLDGNNDSDIDSEDEVEEDGSDHNSDGENE